MREVSSYIIGVPFLTLFALIFIGTSLIHGLIMGNRFAGKKTTSLIPKTEHWLNQALFILPFYGLWGPIWESYGPEATLLGNIPEGLPSIPFSLAVLCGFFTGLAGWTKMDWKSILVAVVIISPTTWFMRSTANPLVEHFLIAGYFAAAGVVSWNILNAIFKATFLKDEIVKDPAGAGASDKVLSGLKGLLQDGKLIERSCCLLHSVPGIGGLKTFS